MIISLFCAFFLNDDIINSKLPWAQNYNENELLKLVIKFLLSLIIIVGL